MIMKLIKTALMGLLYIICISVNIFGANADQLKEFNNFLLKPSGILNEFQLEDFSLKHKDFELYIQSGKISFIQPFEIDSVKKYFCCFIKGEGSFRFHPIPSIEKFQMQRFFESDSLNRPFDEALLFFDERIYQQLLTASQGETKQNIISDVNQIQDFINHFTKNVVDNYIIKILRNLISHGSDPFLLVNASVKDAGQLIYLYDSYEREEIQLLKRYGKLFQNKFLELICSYSSIAEEDCTNINGINKDEIKVTHYKTNSNVDHKGKYSGVIDMDFTVLVENTQILKFELHPYLKVDSLQDSTGINLNYSRWKMSGKGEGPIYLFLDSPLKKGENITLTFYNHGEISDRHGDIMFVGASSDWYPTYNYRQCATFDMYFRTPKDFGFDAVGEQIRNEIFDDTLFTNYRIKKPTPFASFNIGKFLEFDSTSELGTKVTVHYMKKLHRDLSLNLHISKAKNAESQVAQDVMNCLNLYGQYFGDYINDNITITEIIASHSQAYSGYIQLGLWTWAKSTDDWNYERMFRSHEVAHQWWGAGVGYETYHDKWLSEGFAEYSSLLYLQAVGGNVSLEKLLKQYQEEIYSARKYLLGSGKETGPIALGYRTSSSATRGDFNLLIYNKAAFVLHMLRNLLLDLDNFNEAKFLGIMREYYQTYNGKKATTHDFKKIAEKYAEVDLTWFFKQWVFGNELPTYKFKYKIRKKNDDLYYVTCNIKQEGVSEDFKMLIPIEIEFKNGSKYYMRLTVDKFENQIELPPMDQKPKKIRLNPFFSVLADVKQ